MGDPYQPEVLRTQSREEMEGLPWEVVGTLFTWRLECSSQVYGGNRSPVMLQRRSLHVGRGCTSVGLANFFCEGLHSVFLPLGGNHTALPL